MIMVGAFGCDATLVLKMGVSQYPHVVSTYEVFEVNTKQRNRLVMFGKKTHKTAADDGKSDDHEHRLLALYTPANHAHLRSSS